MKNTRRLTEGAILLAAFAVLLSITFYVPVIGTVASFFLPLPFLMFAAKYDWKSSMVFVIASLLLSFVFGTVLSLPLTLASGITGAVMGVQINRKKDRMVIYVSGFIVLLVIALGTYGVSILFFKQDMIQESIDLFKSSLKTSAGLLTGMGQGQQAKQMVTQFNQAFDLLKSLVPMFFIISSAITVIITQAICFPILKRFGIKIPSGKPFRELTLPRNLLWYFVGILTISLLVHPQNGSFLQMAILNLTYLLFLLMVIQGYSLIMYYFHQKGMSKTTTVIIVIISLFISIILYIVALLGIMDLGFDLRKRLAK